MHSHNNTTTNTQHWRLTLRVDLPPVTDWLQLVAESRKRAGGAVGPAPHLYLCHLCVLPACGADCCTDVVQPGSRRRSLDSTKSIYGSAGLRLKCVHAASRFGSNKSHNYQKLHGSTWTLAKRRRYLRLRLIGRHSKEISFSLNSSFFLNSTFFFYNFIVISNLRLC